MNPFSRARRFAKRAGSPGAFFRNAAEEVLVRAWSRKDIRAIGRTLTNKGEPEKWVFLVGCYNSGTTILQHILNAHPQIAGLPREGVRFTDVLSNLETHGHHMMWGDDWRENAEPKIPEAEAYKQIRADWSLFQRADRPVFFDKSIANTARISWLNRTFPNAHFIALHRNGYCIAEGLHRRAMPPHWFKAKYRREDYPLSMTGQQWVTINNVMLEGLKNIDQKVLVRFEDLIISPDKIVTDIFNFLSVEGVAIHFQDRRLQVHETSFDIHDPNPTSLKRLNASQIMELKPIIGPMMERLGYE